MDISGLHLLLTYQCNHECDHCFVWGSPRQSGTMTFRDILGILQQAKETPTIKTIYFEGGEPFLYYPVLLKAVRQAVAMGFEVGIVSNGYWATDTDDAMENLKPFAGLIEDLSISSDLYHWDETISEQSENAHAAADTLSIPVGVITLAQPESSCDFRVIGQLPAGESSVRYRGRAADSLVGQVPLKSWETFTECPCEDLRDPGRLHVDPLGNLHICQGISIGNLFANPLKQICETYDPDSHEITTVLLESGPAGLARYYGVARESGYADACHLCYDIRRKLRDRFPEILTPDQMYGVPEDMGEAKPEKTDP